MPSAFTGPLSITEVDPKLEIWRLNEPLTYDVGYLGSGCQIVVPVGIFTDAASIPPWLTWVLPKWGRYRRAAILHDYLCQQLRLGTPHPYALSRTEADRIFREAMTVLEVNCIVREVLYFGVRLGARFPSLGAKYSAV